MSELDDMKKRAAKRILLYADRKYFRWEIYAVVEKALCEWMYQEGRDLCVSALMGERLLVDECDCDRIDKTPEGQSCEWVVDVRPFDGEMDFRDEKGLPSNLFDEDEVRCTHCNWEGLKSECLDTGACAQCKTLGSVQVQVYE
jgi:hypothetical protein